MIPASVLPSTIPTGLGLPRVRISFARPVRRVPRLGALAVQSGPLALTPGEQFSVRVTLVASGSTTAYWTLTANVIDGAGSTVGAMTAADGATTAYGSGSAKVDFTSQALDALGSYGVVVTLHVYADAARTQEVSGSPETRTAAPIVSVVSATPTSAPSLTMSLSSSVVTLRWTSVANGQSYEVQQTNQSGAQQVAVVASGAQATGNSSGTLTADPQGIYGYFVLGDQAQFQLAAGTTTYWRVRAVGGTAGAGGTGPWSNIVTATIAPGVPRIVYTVSGVQWTPLYTTAGGSQQIGLSFQVTVANQGTAAGAGNIETALVDPNHSNFVVGYSGGSSLLSGPAVDEIDGIQTLSPGQSAVWQFSLAFGGWWQYGEPLPVAGSTHYILHVAPVTTGYDRYPYEANSAFQPDPGDVAFTLTYLSSAVSVG